MIVAKKEMAQIQKKQFTIFLIIDIEGNVKSPNRNLSVA